MYNYFMLIGTVAADIDYREVLDGKRVANIRLAVAHEFKNADGSIGVSYFQIALWETMAEIAKTNLQKGCKLGIKGRLYPKSTKNEDGTYTYTTNLIAERLFLFDEQLKIEKIIDQQEQEEA